MITATSNSSFYIVLTLSPGFFVRISRCICTFSNRSGGSSGAGLMGVLME